MKIKWEVWRQWRSCKIKRTTTRDESHVEVFCGIDTESTLTLMGQESLDVRVDSSHNQFLSSLSLFFTKLSFSNKNKDGKLTLCQRF